MPAPQKVSLPSKIKNKLKKIVTKDNLRSGKNRDEETYVEDILKEIIIANELEDYKVNWKKEREENFKTDIANKRQQLEDEL